MKTLTWQKPGQQNVAQELIKIIINYVAELRVNNYFTCKQTARLMSIFTWDDEKMKVLRMISNRIVDRENGKEIIKTLDSLFKQDDARKILGITNQW